MILLNLIVTILLTVIIHSSILSNFAINGVIGNISLAVIVSIALLLKKPYGSIVGLFIGLLQDILFGPIIGLNALIYFVLGYSLENLEGRIDRDNILIPVIAVIVLTAMYNFLYYTLIFFIGRKISFLYYIKTKLWIEMIYNALLMIPVYKLLSKVFKAPSVMFVRD